MHLGMCPYGSGKAVACGTIIKFRLLPDGEFCDGVEVARNGDVLDIDFRDQSLPADFHVGAPVELQSDSEVYLGILQERRTAGASILVEHYLDRCQIKWIDDVWG